MVVIHNKNPIKQTFNAWINSFPESFHWCDMDRFYRFVKAVCRYSRKPKNSIWLQEQISKSGKKLSEEVIQIYCEKFDELQRFYHATCIRIYESR